jgi:hypothetical protein
LKEAWLLKKGRFQFIARNCVSVNGVGDRSLIPPSVAIVIVDLHTVAE